MRKRYGATRFDDDAGQGAAMFGPVLRFFESGKDREGLHAEALGGSAAWNAQMRESAASGYCTRVSALRMIACAIVFDLASGAPSRSTVTITWLDPL